MTPPISDAHETVLTLASIPSPPKAHAFTTAGDARGHMPHAAELAVFDGAIGELERCHDFNEIFGQLLGPAPHVITMFQRAAHWTAMRAKAEAFEEYCRGEERRSWANLRPLMARMRPTLDLVARGHADLAQRFVNLADLLGVHRDVARRASATRKANAATKVARAAARLGSMNETWDLDDDS